MPGGPFLSGCGQCPPPVHFLDTAFCLQGQASFQPAAETLTGQLHYNFQAPLQLGRAMRQFQPMGCGQSEAAHLQTSPENLPCDPLLFLTVCLLDAKVQDNLGSHLILADLLSSWGPEPPSTPSAFKNLIRLCVEWGMNFYWVKSLNLGVYLL